MEILELRSNRRQGLWTIAVSIVALGLGVCVGSRLAMGVGLVGVLVGLWAVLDRRVKLRIDEFGVFYTRFGYTPIQWAEIARIEVRTFRGVDQVCLVPHDPELILERMSHTQRWASWLAAKVWGCRFIVSSAGLERGTDALLRALRSFREQRAGPGGGG